KYSDCLIDQILKLVDKEAFTYQSYSTSRDPKRSDGTLTIQFNSLNRSEGVFASFNVSLTRVRASKHGAKGSRYPKGQFNPYKGGSFVGFWKRAGLPIPGGGRYSKIHEYMGNLKGIIYSADVGASEKSAKSNKVSNCSLQPLEVSAESIIEALNNVRLAHKTRTTNAQDTNNLRTKTTHKKNELAHTDTNLQTDSGAGENHHGNKVKGVKVNSNPIDTNVYPINPIDQTNEQWVAEFDSAKAL
ncbi:MAG: hypothetical protein RLP12_15280, partial [Ekhidna sp.]